MMLIIMSELFKYTLLATMIIMLWIALIMLVLLAISEGLEIYWRIRREMGKNGL